MIVSGIVRRNSIKEPAKSQPVHRTSWRASLFLRRTNRSSNADHTIQEQLIKTMKTLPMMSSLCAASRKIDTTNEYTKAISAVENSEATIAASIKLSVNDVPYKDVFGGRTSGNTKSVCVETMIAAVIIMTSQMIVIESPKDRLIMTLKATKNARVQMYAPTTSNNRFATFI
jgi:hypothetical protein